MRPRKAQCLLWLLSQTSILLPSIAFSTTTQQNKPWMADADRAVDVLKDAKSILFVTGAGISAESGLPTYVVLFLFFLFVFRNHILSLLLTCVDTAEYRACIMMVVLL